MFVTPIGNTGKARFYANKYSLIGGCLRKHTYFEEGDGNPPPPPVVPPSPPPPPGTLPAKTFTQADIDKMMAEHRKGLQETNKQLIGELEQLKQKAGLTEQEKDSLQTRIEQLENAHLTEAQRLKAEQEKAAKKYEVETKTLVGQRDEYKTLFQNTMIENALTLAASNNKAARAEQIIKMFGRDAKLVQILDNAGKPTGKYDVQLPVEVEDPKTKQKEILDLSANEALAKIKEKPEFYNLFLDTQGSGIGGNNDRPGSNGTPDFSKMNPEQYRKWKLQQQGGK